MQFTSNHVSQYSKIKEESVYCSPKCLVPLTRHSFFFNVFFLQVTVNLLIKISFYFCCFAFTYGKNIVRIYTQELSKLLSLPSPIDSLDPFDQILALTFYAGGLKI